MNWLCAYKKGSGTRDLTFLIHLRKLWKRVRYPKALDEVSPKEGGTNGVVQGTTCNA